MINLSIDPEIRHLFPNIQVGWLTGEIQNTPHDQQLWNTVAETSQHLRERHDFESIREIPAIRSAKKAYRMLGKDPNRYRISAEAMIRRIVKGQSLYQIHTAVDLLNLVSLITGVTIGGFDQNSITPPILLSAGQPGETFEAIGRGEINIDRLPVYRDRVGPMGSPTSDCTRTMLQIHTTAFLMIVTDFFGESFIHPTLDLLVDKMTIHANGRNFQKIILNEHKNETPIGQ